MASEIKKWQVGRARFKSMIASYFFLLSGIHYREVGEYGNSISVWAKDSKCPLFYLKTFFFFSLASLCSATNTASILFPLHPFFPLWRPRFRHPFQLTSFLFSFVTFSLAYYLSVSARSMLSCRTSVLTSPDGLGSGTRLGGYRPP